MIATPTSAPITIPAMAPPLRDDEEEGEAEGDEEGKEEEETTGVVVDEVVSRVVGVDVVCVAAMRAWGSKDQELALGLAEESDEYVWFRVVELMLRRRSWARAQQMLIWPTAPVHTSLDKVHQCYCHFWADLGRGTANLLSRQHHVVSPLPQSSVLPSVAQSDVMVQHTSPVSQQYLFPVDVSRAQAFGGLHRKELKPGQTWSVELDVKK